MSLQESLALRDYVTWLLGGDLEAVLTSLGDFEEGRRADRQSTFFSVFEGRSGRLHIPLEDVARFDLNLLDHQDALARSRPGFGFRYFQWLAGLYTEIFLDRYVADPAELLLELNRHARREQYGVPRYVSADLRMLAMWMATGAGKTLLLHLNLRQFLHYRPFDPANILLLTPTATLATQHLDELRQSGIEAEYGLAAPSIFSGVQVLEITKLYVDAPTTRSRKGGVSLPVSQFEGPNLLLVDEGHKGGSTRADQRDEQAWRGIRDALSEGGFTFEYSATFGQVTEDNEDLYDLYSRSIVFEYAYRRFYEDGYGKDFAVFNLRDPEFYGDDLLLAGLLAFYERVRLFADEFPAVSPYQIADPLHVFVGAQVNAGPEVLQVVTFLNRVLVESDWAEERIGGLLRGKSGLPGPDDNDLFADRFPYLRAKGFSAASAYDDLRQRLFGGTSGLSLHLLMRADGEIGVRTPESPKDVYCGVVNIGDASAFLGRVATESEVEVGEPDFFTPSLFGSLDTPGSPIQFLIGSKKFVEGWSSWRVAVMALLRVGQGAGAQVLQLFGRGVRLRGRDFGLKRSSALEGDHPPYLPLLEELTIFGLSANYLHRFLETLLEEGVDTTETRLFPVTLQRGFVAAGLKGLELDSEYSFEDEVHAFIADEASVVLELSVRTHAGGAGGLEAAKQTYQPAQLPIEARRLLDLDALVAHARNYKTQKGWAGLFVRRAEVERFLSDVAMFAGPADLTQPKTPQDVHSLQRLAETLVEKGLDRFYLPKQRRAEAERLVAEPVETGHSNFPTAHGQPAYILRVSEADLATVENIIADAKARDGEDLDDPLPRLHWDRHLYNPLLVKGAVRSRPGGLVGSEAQFLQDIRLFWKDNCDTEPWANYELYMLRNLPKRGIGFFQAAGFYPDFLVWLRNDAVQSLAFVDPKGLMMVGEFNEKLTLAETLREREFGFPVTSFIVTPTPLEEWPPHQGLAPAELPDRREALAERHVLEQTGDYVQELMARFEALTSTHPA